MSEMNDNKTYITAEQAISILPDGDEIHTFINGGFGLCGADWSRSEIIDKLNKSDKIELAGNIAKGMGHGIAAYNSTAKHLNDVLFIETDMNRLAALETTLGAVGAEDTDYANGKRDALNAEIEYLNHAWT